MRGGTTRILRNTNRELPSQGSGMKKGPEALLNKWTIHDTPGEQVIPHVKSFFHL